MREAADILNSPAAMQIRYLDTLKTMAKESGAKVIFMPPSFSEIGGPLTVDSGPVNSNPVPSNLDKFNLGKPMNLQLMSDM
jgi:hypothetical protein